MHLVPLFVIFFRKKPSLDELQNWIALSPLGSSAELLYKPI